MRQGLTIGSKQHLLSLCLLWTGMAWAKPVAEFRVDPQGFNIPMCIDYLGDQPERFKTEMQEGLLKKNMPGQISDSCHLSPYLGECQNLSAHDFLAYSNLHLNLRWGLIDSLKASPVFDKMLVEEFKKQCSDQGGNWHFPPLDSSAAQAFLLHFQTAIHDQDLDTIRSYFDPFMSFSAQDQSAKICNPLLPKDYRKMGGINAPLVFMLCGPKIWLSGTRAQAIDLLSWQTLGTILAQNPRATLQYDPLRGEIQWIFTRAKTQEIWRFNVYAGSKIFFKSMEIIGTSSKEAKLPSKTP